MLLKDNEEKRNIAWRTVMTVTSVLIILFVVFFAVKLFTSNPLTGNWENTDDGMKLTIKNNGTMDIVQALDESTVSVPVDYTIDMEHKRFAIHVNEEKIAKQAEKTKDCSKQELQDIADVMEGTYEYSVEQNVLTLTDSEYGSQKTFENRFIFRLLQTFILIIRWQSQQLRMELIRFVSIRGISVQKNGYRQ